MQPLEIKITTVAELAGAKAALTQLERQSGAAKVLGKDFSDAVPKIEAARKAIADFERQYAAASKAAQASQISQPAQSGPIRVPVPGTRNINLQDPESERARIASQLKFNTTRAATANKGSGMGQFFSGLNQELTGIFPKLGQLEGLFARLAAGPVGLVAAGIAAVAAAFVAAGKAVKEFASSEKEIARLDTILAQIGDLTEANRKKIQEWAETQQNATGIADEEWIAVARSVLQYSKNASNLERDGEAVKNYAGITGSLQEAAEGVGKALQGNFESFQRHGFVISETATHAQKLAQLYQELAVRGGGQLEASSKTLSGQLQNVKNQFNDIAKGAGQWISETGIIQTGLSALGTGLKFVADLLGHTTEKLEGLHNSLKITGPSIDQINTAIRNTTFAMERMDFATERISTAIAGLVEQMKLANTINLDAAAQSHERELAIIHDFEEAGVISHLDAATARRNIDIRYEREKLALHQKGLENEAKADAALIMHRQDVEARLQSQLADVRSRQGKLDDRQKLISEANTANQAVEVAAEELEKAKKTKPYVSNGLGVVEVNPAAHDKEVAQAQQKYNDAQTVADAAKAKISTNETSRQALDASEKEIVSHLTKVIESVYEAIDRQGDNAILRKMRGESDKAATNQTIAGIKDAAPLQNLEAQSKPPVQPNIAFPTRGVAYQFQRTANQLKRNIWLEDIAENAPGPVKENARVAVDSLNRSQQSTLKLSQDLIGLSRYSLQELQRMQAEVNQLKAWRINSGRQ